MIEFKLLELQIGANIKSPVIYLQNYCETVSKFIANLADLQVGLNWKKFTDETIMSVWAKGEIVQKVKIK